MARLRVDPTTGKLVPGGDGGLHDSIVGPGALFEPTGNAGDAARALLELDED